MFLESNKALQSCSGSQIHQAYLRLKENEHRPYYLALIDFLLSLPDIVSAAQWLTGKMGRALPGMVSRSGGFPVVQNLS